MLTQIKKNKLSRISASETLSTLQAQFSEAPLTLRDIENVYEEVKKAMNRGLPAVQAMLSKLGDEYQFQYVLDDHDRLERVLFFHNASLQLLRLFPKSYVLDATYRTNRFNLPPNSSAIWTGGVSTLILKSTTLNCWAGGYHQ
jgi:hypothetical protein